MQGNLFARYELPESKEIQFYQHDVGWRNRLILGDSLLVMSSLLEREHMAGKVQCIYIDPPYGVKFNSNFQPAISRRDVKDGDDASLTREPEQIQAYRDTWTLGIHSYLTYMRDRLLLARELLAETGSIFVQISDENVHHVRELLGEVFGEENFVSLITVEKTGAQTSELLGSVADYLLWYARDRQATKFRRLFLPKEAGVGTGSGERYDQVDDDGRMFQLTSMTSMSVGREKGLGAASWFPVKFAAREFLPPAERRWTTNESGMQRLIESGRIVVAGKTLRYKRYLDDFPAYPLTSIWGDTAGSPGKVYVVQTSPLVVARCILMTTDPGDLVLDPTCGSATTAFVAEQWGRRWITCDTSRVALALARQRLLTARYPFYRLRSQRVRDGFHYRTVPHVTLKSIAQNPRLDECTTQAERERVIRESADQEVLYDQPDVDTNRIRVSGPFTVEAIPVASLQLPDDAAEPGRPPPTASQTSDAAGDYLGMMIDLVKKTGIQFAHGRNLPLPNLRPVRGPYEYLHADVKVHAEKEEAISVELIGIDLYDPNTGDTRHSTGEDVAAWFVDHDYDGRTFCVCQALFPGGGSKNPWEKLQKALKGTIDEEKFEALRSKRSLPFKPGKKVAVKVIDDRGNEVIKLVEAKARARGKAGA